MPVILAGLEEHAVAGTDDLDRPSATLRAPDALGDADRLTVWVGVPRGPRARREMDAARVQARGPRRSREAVDIRRAREPPIRPLSGSGAVPGDFHDFLLPLGPIRAFYRSHRADVIRLGTSRQGVKEPNGPRRYGYGDGRDGRRAIGLVRLAAARDITCPGGGGRSCRYLGRRLAVEWTLSLPQAHD